MHQNALPWGTLDRMAAECAFYLCTPLRSESYVEASFTVTMVASDLVLAATESDVDVPRKYFIDSNEVWQFILSIYGATFLTMVSIAYWKVASHCQGLECTTTLGASQSNCVLYREPFLQPPVIYSDLYKLAGLWPQF